jgi:hypothetical protein
MSVGLCRVKCPQQINQTDLLLCYLDVMNRPDSTSRSSTGAGEKDLRSP